MIKIFQYSEKLQGKRKLLKNPECKSILNAVKNFRANCVFVAAMVLQNQWYDFPDSNFYHPHCSLSASHTMITAHIAALVI